MRRMVETIIKDLSFGEDKNSSMISSTSIGWTNEEREKKLKKVTYICIYNIDRGNRGTMLNIVLYNNIYLYLSYIPLLLTNTVSLYDTRRHHVRNTN